MSSWGNLDNVQISGNVVTSNVSATVTGYGGAAFTTDVDAGDYITIASNKYQVASVVSATVLTLTANAATNSDNVKAFVQQGPKYISNVSTLQNTYTIQNIVGVDRVEIAVPENKARGVASHTGWIDYKTYSTTQGATRHKSEVLVALSKNFSANAAGSLFGTGAGTDGNDDTVAADSLIYFTTQPANVSADTGNAAVFFVVAASDPTGASIGYQWYEDNTTHTYAIADGANYSGNTTNTLTINDVTGLDGYEYYVVISGDGGADSNTSDTATLTETTP